MNPFLWIRKHINKNISIFRRKKLYKFFENRYISSIVKDDFKRLPSSLTGHCPVLTEDSFYKIVYQNFEFFYFEKANIEFINNLYPDLAKFIPDYQYEKNYFKIDALSPVEDPGEQVIAAEKLLSELARYSKKEKINPNSMEYIVEGLKILKFLFGNKGSEKYLKVKNRVEKIFESNEYNLGPAHGDFHSKNIMKKQKSGGTFEFLMIDFDCFRRKSIQEFDAIYFLVQCIADASEKIWWHGALIQLDEQISKNSEYKHFFEKFVDFNQLQDLKFLYFIDRVGQDQKYFKNYKDAPKEDILKTIDTLELN